MMKPGVVSRASFEDMEEGMPVQEEQDSQIHVCISPSSADTSRSRKHSQDDRSSLTMLKSGVAPLASLEDLEEEVPMLPDPNSEEQKSPMEHCFSSSSIYESASELTSQDDWMSATTSASQDYCSSSSIYISAPEICYQDDCCQHPSEAMDEIILTRVQGAQAEAQQSVHHSATNGDGEFQSIEITDQLSWTQNTCVEKFKDRMALEKKLINSFGPSASRWSQLPIHHLLFRAERDVLKKLVHSEEKNVLENFYKEARSIWNDEQSWERGNTFQTTDDFLLVAAIADASDTLKHSENRETFRAQKISVFLLLLFPVLYLLDIATDIYVAYKHCSEANYLYFGLTLVFIFGPMLGEITRKIYMKHGNPSLTWKMVFSLESLTMLPRAFRSIRYAADSRRDFDSDLVEFYEELNRSRGGESNKMAEKLRRSNMSLINAHSFAAMVANEQWQLHWKLNEALNESAPQLLLQLVIVLIQLGNGKTVGLLTYIGMLTSLASFVWSLHLYHYSKHYEGLVNNFKLLHRATDFFAHFLIVGCRFIALSIVMALYSLWFFVAAFFYLGFLFLYLYYCSSDRDDYREITKEGPLWIVHRLFTTPHNMDIWKMDRYNDLLYYLENFALALCWPFLLDDGHPLADNRWIITGIIFILYFIILPLLVKINERMFENSPFCDVHDPFLIRLKLWEDLAGKTRVGRLFGRNTCTSTSSST